MYLSLKCDTIYIRRYEPQRERLDAMTVYSIVLEGPDYSGKSTLAQAIVDNWLNRPNTTAEIVHTGSPGPKPESMSIEEWKQGQISSLTRKIYKYLDVDKDNHMVVFDRFAWGAPIYGPLHRPDTNYKDENFGDLGHTGFMYVDSVLAFNGGMTVHVGTPLHTILSRADMRDDPYLDDHAAGKSREEQLAELWFRYFQFAANVGQYLPSSYSAPVMVGKVEDSDVNRDLKMLSNMNAQAESKNNWIDQGRFEQYVWSSVRSKMSETTNSTLIAGHLINKAIDRQIQTQHSLHQKPFLVGDSKAKV